MSTRSIDELVSFVFSIISFPGLTNNLELKSNFSKFLWIANTIQLDFLEEGKNDGGYNRNKNIIKISFSLV